MAAWAAVYEVLLLIECTVCRLKHDANAGPKALDYRCAVLLFAEPLQPPAAHDAPHTAPTALAWPVLLRMLMSHCPRLAPRIELHAVAAPSQHVLAQASARQHQVGLTWGALCARQEGGAGPGRAIHPQTPGV